MQWLVRSKRPHTAVSAARPQHAVPTGSALSRAFAAVSRNRTAETEAELRAAVAAFVEPLKADRVPPERIIVALKKALGADGTVQTFASILERHRNRESVLDDGAYALAFDCCLEAYFDGPSRESSRMQHV